MHNSELLLFTVPPGFKRDDLRSRYDVATIEEDDWHSYSGRRTSEFLTKQLSLLGPSASRLLNAGAGVYGNTTGQSSEISVDLFSTPIKGRKNAVCASVERLPFSDAYFSCVLCVGEVLAYCDPAAAFSEFSRVLAPSGTLICDFGSSRSATHWFSSTFARAADLVVDDYNGSPEKTWRYDPRYISSLLQSFGLETKATLGVHTWSAIARRLGATCSQALFAQEKLDWIPLPANWADLITFVAVKRTGER
ncbi:methyltransferase domain-containing protein [Bradyrhizobium sp.]|uniref:methyltransferase domain-containing protein n=1 Tax=Bradyrhizobium sp. TaxID=376 RepID=UPI00403791EB